MSKLALEQSLLKIIDYEKAGMEVVDNSPDELNEAFLDFEKSMQRTSELYDLKLQKKFWTIMSTWSDYNKFHGKYNAKISHTFD